MRRYHPVTRVREPVVERNEPHAEPQNHTHDSHDDRSIGRRNLTAIIRWMLYRWPNIYPYHYPYIYPLSEGNS
jgi:hypothetical protein